MSSDGYFEDDIDDNMLRQLDAIEAAHLSPQKHPSPRPLARHNSSFDGYGMTFDIDDSELRRLDTFIEDAYQGKAGPVAGPSNRGQPPKGTVQTTLFGDILPNTAPRSRTQSNTSSSRMQARHTNPTTRNPFGQQAAKTKMWDHTAFAKSGMRSGKSKGKGKIMSNNDDEEEEEDEVEFEQFPAPFVSVGPPPPMKLSPDLLEAKHWIYPLNQPKRDYQFNIVRHCLFENTLVALPTGLGKTFIAGVVMLNFYRWYPTGKIVFVAPTKPLVAQQIDACHQTCGIPGSYAIELTGQNPRSMRARAWQEKRIFYMTPQTLINDLTTECCDVRDIVLIVIDEAHRGSGDYAYAQVIRFLMAKNPHFRVLALTATPGSTPDAVQAIVDALHISRIEIRDEGSLDLKEYVFKKNIKQHIINMTDDINRVKTLLAKLIDEISKPLRSSGIIYGNIDAVRMSSFLPQSIMQRLNKNQKWAYGALSMLSTLARAMGYLIEGTIGQCATYLQGIARGADEVGEDGETSKKSNKGKKLLADPTFKAILKEVEMQRHRPSGFSLHPKMEKLKTMVVQHFGEKMGDPDENDVVVDTKVMVFATFRETVDEIVELLNTEQPLIRATRFVGQSADKQGKKGIAQKEQLEVIKKFKTGSYNVLVSTSVGEEGLDIGEIDMIVCYDAQKTPIRMLQRVGRTGRKREGYVHVLLSEGREELNLDKAKATYKDVQKSIVRGDQLELYADVERLLPDHIKPECLEKIMEIQLYERDDGRKNNIVGDGDSSTKGKKRKRDDNIGRNMPAGASSGFVSVKDLLVKGAGSANAPKRKRVVKVKEFDEMAGEDDDEDREIEEGVVALRRAASSSITQKDTKRGKGKLRKTKTLGDGDKTVTTTKKSRMKKAVEPTSSQFSQKGVDDSDDVDIERGVVSLTAPLLKSNGTSVAKYSKSPNHGSSSEDLLIVQKSIIELLSSDDESQMSSPQRNSGLSPAIRRRARVLRVGDSTEASSTDEPPADTGTVGRPLTGGSESMAWLVEEDDDPVFDIVDSSPIPTRPRPLSPITAHDNENSEIEFVDNEVNITSPRTRNLCLDNNSPILLHGHHQSDSSIEFAEESEITSRLSRHHQLPPGNTGRLANDDVVITLASDRIPIPRGSSPLPTRSPTQCVKKPVVRKLAMAPPDFPAHLPVASPELPESSFPVRAAGKPLKTRNNAPDDLASPLLNMPPRSQRRLRKKRSISPVLHPGRSGRKRKRDDPTGPGQHNPLLDIEALHSGDEFSAGSSVDDDELEENEDDRMFLREPPETQMSSSYDQTIAYRQSLLTQAPSNAPQFDRRPARRGIFGAGANRPRPLVSSSPIAEGGALNEYAVGSFVVDDDTEILLAHSSSEL